MTALGFLHLNAAVIVQQFGIRGVLLQQQNQQIVNLLGRVQSITFQNPDNGFTVLTLANNQGEAITVVGSFAACLPGETLQMQGRYVEHKAYGQQFEMLACQYQLPEDADDIEMYLASGALPGIGPATAKHIVARFGQNALQTLAQEPERLAEIKGLSLQKARMAQQTFLEMFGMREIITGLGGLGLVPMEAVLLYRSFGKETLDNILQNPYCLCGWPLYASFMRADAIAKTLSEEPDEQMRAKAALLYTLRHNMTNGHTCIPKAKLLNTSANFFKIDPALLAKELAATAESGETLQTHYNNTDFVYLALPYRAELEAALRIKMMNAMPAPAPKNIEKMIEIREKASGILYAPLQRKAIAEAMGHSVMVITGGPGTGKTTTVNAIISLFEQQAERVLLAAPTGRAAKRMAELTGRKASTLHRLLEVDFSEGQEFPRFKRNAKNPLKCDVLIVDEMSMVDVFLFDSLLCALRPGARLVMVGDMDQLPSVGPGNVLKGILESGIVPSVVLREIFRQAAQSLIVKNAHHIVGGLPPQSGGKTDDFFFIPSAGMACQELVLSLVHKRLPKSYGFCAAEDIQVLCPGRKGALGTEELNIKLQQLLNPPVKNRPEIKVFGMVFRQGDKVMQIKNDYDIPFTRINGEPGAGAFNGEIGVVEHIGKGTMTVLCEDRRLEYTTETLHKLELAYAVTIHKSQGSEFEAVVIPLADVPQKLRYRNLLYTAVTRAKRLCVLAGEEEILLQMVGAGNKNRRYSCFKNFLQSEDLA